MTVVGVAANVVQNDRTRQTFEPIVYVPYAQHSPPNMFAFVRTMNEPERLLGAVRQQLYSLDPDLPVPALGTMDARFARLYATERQTGVVVLCFAAVTLLIAVFGLRLQANAGLVVKEADAPGSCVTPVPAPRIDATVLRRPVNLILSRRL